MASLPPQRPASQRRASPPTEATSSQQERVVRTNSFSAQSIDSQTVLLNSPSRQSSQPALETQKEASRQQSAPQEEDEEPRKCWICFNDETEDDETSSEWRSPCACSLVAHEKCLLDWIADMEAPSSRRRAGTRAGKVLCPQCKSEIVIERPRSVVVEGVRVIERLTGSLLLPSLALVTGTALYSTLTVAGTHTIYQIFGTADALQILGPLYETPNPRAASLAMQTLQHLRQHWRLDLGLPLIPAVLVASRTTFADSFLPFLPLIFFVSSGQPGDDMLQLQWPPSAAFTFATLPYLRGFYNAYYERVWLPREQQWLKEIQPRAGEDTAADGQIQVEDEVQIQNEEEVEDIEIEVDFDIFADWNNGGEADNHGAQENPPVPIARGPARPIDAPPMDDDNMPELADIDQPPQGNQQGAAPAPNIPLQPAAPRRQRIRRERNIAFSTTSLADTILGALIFPSIAAAMGELLRHTLPASWVTPPAGGSATSWLGGWVRTGGKVGTVGKPTGFLQTRWGRSIVGGCLFVGFKDAVLLYVRWKMAQNHRRRKIIDFDDEEVPGHVIYGPRGERKRDWDARVGDQPVHDNSWAAFQKRARERKGKPIEYQQVTFPNEESLHVDALLALDSKDKKVRQLLFAPDVNVDDAIIDHICRSDEKLRVNLQSFFAGDASHTRNIDITDTGIEKLVKACPNLIAVTLYGTSKIGKHAFPTILKACDKIESVIISVAKAHVSKRTKLNETTNWLMDTDFVPKRRYLEFRDVYLTPEHRGFLNFLTERRPQLEIVFKYDNEAVFIRNMDNVPLSTVPNRKDAIAENDLDDEDAWEDVSSDDEVTSRYKNFYLDDMDDDFYDESLISSDPRENARTLARLGQQSALSDALGRDLYDFETDSDYGDYDDYVDSDEEVSPESMRTLLRIMNMMDRDMR